MRPRQAGLRGHGPRRRQSSAELQPRVVRGTRARKPSIRSKERASHMLEIRPLPEAWVPARLADLSSSNMQPVRKVPQIRKLSSTDLLLRIACKQAPTLPPAESPQGLFGFLDGNTSLQHA